MVTNPTLIGGDPNNVQAQHFNGQLAGLYAFDRFLDDAQVALVADNIKIPFDMSTAVVAQDDASFDKETDAQAVKALVSALQSPPQTSLPSSSYVLHAAPLKPSVPWFWTML